MAIVDQQQFSRRLIAALKLRGFLAERQARFGVDANALAKLAKKSRQAARKWLEGDAMPEHETCQLIAKSLNISYFWLRYGIGSMDRELTDELLMGLLPILDELPTQEQKDAFKAALLAYAELLGRELTKPKTEKKARA